jgi:murein endopeptidase
MYLVFVGQWQFTSILVATVALGAATARDVGAAEPNVALSLGYPNAGRLVDGRHFHSTPYMVSVPSHANSRVRWALPALLSVLDRASRIVARKFPGSVLEIGELSRHDGGPIASHLSHQNGRDADVGFYFVDMDGQPVRADTFLRCYGSGDGRDDPTLRFDEKRNWAFVKAVLEDPHYEVRQIFIYAPLRARLLAYAAKVGAPRELRVKAAAAMMQPVNALPHDDHFHIRISCPADQVEAGCADLPLWRAPGSPDEFGPELLAQLPPIRWVRNAFPPEGWGRLSQLWSIERGVCDKSGLACVDDQRGLACEDLGDLASPWILAPASQNAALVAEMPMLKDLGWKLADSTEIRGAVDASVVPLAEGAARTPTFLQTALRVGEVRGTLPSSSGLWVGAAEDFQSVLRRCGSARRCAFTLGLDTDDGQESAPIAITTQGTTTPRGEASPPGPTPSPWFGVIEEPLN